MPDLTFLMDITWKLNSFNCERQAKNMIAADRISALNVLKHMLADVVFFLKSLQKIKIKNRFLKNHNTKNLLQTEGISAI